MNNIVNLLNIRNSGRGGKLKFTCDGKDYISNNLKELVDKLYDVSRSFPSPNMV